MLTSLSIHSTVVPIELSWQLVLSHPWLLQYMISPVCLSKIHFSMIASYAFNLECAYSYQGCVYCHASCMLPRALASHQSTLRMRYRLGKWKVITSHIFRFLHIASQIKSVMVTLVCLCVHSSLYCYCYYVVWVTICFVL